MLYSFKMPHAYGEYNSELTIEEATEIARVASEAARVAAEIAKAATAQLAELEEQRIAGQLAEAEAARLAEETVAATLIRTEKELAEANTGFSEINEECVKFMKDSSGIEDKVSHAKRLGDKYQEAKKQQAEATRLHNEAKKADMPFQVPRLRKEVAALEAELAEVEAKRSELQMHLKECANLDTSIKNVTLRHDLTTQHMSISHTLRDLTNRLRLKTSVLHTAEIAAGLRFANYHPAHHEMILQATMNGGNIRTPLCSCGYSAGIWTTDSPYPPRCQKNTPKCGKAAW